MGGWGDLLLFGCVVLLCVGGGGGAGCGDRGHPMCCPGRNSLCHPPAPHPRKPDCFCDSYCQRTGDCCMDYHQVCHISAINCLVGVWGGWSPCSSLCGVGSRNRSRQVLMPPHNGGRPCPELKQRRGCYGHEPSNCHSIKEVAQVLPDSYTRNFKDPWKRPHLMMKEQKSSYCAYFRMKQVSVACRLGAWTNRVLRDKSVCVECQGEAMRSRDRCEGDGLEGVRTFWTAAATPGCQGSWVQSYLVENCQCPPDSLIFI